jgi:hypothetical protein
VILAHFLPVFSKITSTSPSRIKSIVVCSIYRVGKKVKQMVTNLVNRFNSYFSRRERAEDGSDKLPFLIFLFLFVLFFIFVLMRRTRPAVRQLDRSTSLLVREFITERDVRNPEIAGRDDRFLLAGLQLQTPTSV